MSTDTVEWSGIVAPTRIKADIHRIEPLLRHDPTDICAGMTTEGGVCTRPAESCPYHDPDDDHLAPDEFRIRDTPLRGRSDARAIIQLLRHTGCLDCVRVENAGGKARNIYRWRDGVREQLRTYLDELSTLPCDHRIHVPDTRDDPEGIISCKYCGEEYPEAFFRNLVREQM